MSDDAAGAPKGVAGTTVASSASGLVKAIWALSGTVLAAVAAIFWAGFYWHDINSRLNKIEEFDKKFTHLQTLPVLDDKTGVHSAYTYKEAVMCGAGEVVRGIQSTDGRVIFFCGPLLPR